MEISGSSLEQHAARHHSQGSLAANQRGHPKGKPVRRRNLHATCRTSALENTMGPTLAGDPWRTTPAAFTPQLRLVTPGVAPPGARRAQGRSKTFPAPLSSDPFLLVCTASVVREPPPSKRPHAHRGQHKCCPRSTPHHFIPGSVSQQACPSATFWGAVPGESGASLAHSSRTDQPLTAASPHLRADSARGPSQGHPPHPRRT